MTVQTIPTPETTKDLIDPLDKSTNKSGFKRAHVIGDAFAQDDGALRKIGLSCWLRIGFRV